MQLPSEGTRTRIRIYWNGRVSLRTGNAYILVTTLKAVIVAAKSPSKALALEEALPLSF